MMALKDNGICILITGACGFPDHHVVCSVTVALEAVIICELHEVCCNGIGIAGAMRNRAYFFKILKDIFRIAIC